MNNYPVSKIRNVCLIAHSKAGKTSLTEAMFFNAKATDRLGKVADGNTVCDYDPEEIKRKISINSAMATLEWKDSKINFIDTPGYFDFIGEMLGGVRVADSAVIVVSGKSGVSVGTEISWKLAEEKNIPVMFFINKMDEENANFESVLNGLQSIFGKKSIPLQIPIKDGAKFTGYIDVIDEKYFTFDGKEAPIPDSAKEEISIIKDSLNEAIAETSDTLMDKFFGGEPFTHQEFVAGIKDGVKQRAFFPILCGSAISNLNITTLMDACIEYLPSPDQANAEIAKLSKDDSEIELKNIENEPLSALVFKTIADPFVGKLSLFKVYSGNIKHDTTIFNANTETNEKIGHLYVLRGKKQIEVEKLSAGEIGAVTKLVNTHTGNTLCDISRPIKINGITFPKPVFSLAVQPKARGDEEKIGLGLQRLSEEDPTFSFVNNTETHQLIISGLGDQHLDVIINKLKAKYGTAVNLIEPKVSYRETITKKLKVEGKHKKQSGGHGQYGHVWIEFEPCESDDLVFHEKIFGGSVPKNFHPAVEKGLKEMMVNGIQAGYKTVGIKATLVDGSYHDVDSSEMAFKLAAHEAFKKLNQASPILLEPIGHLEVIVPDSYTGDVIGDINKRRGRILGMNPGEVIAEVPMSEMFKYAIDLRSMTHGRGNFSFKFERYEQAPPNIAQKVTEQHSLDKKDEAHA